MLKKRILFVLVQLDAGGSERIVLELAKGLDPEQFDVYVAAFKSGVLDEEFRSVCKNVFIVEKKPGFDKDAIKQFSKIIKLNNIDVVNAHHYMPLFYSFFGTKLFNDKRIVYTEHSVPEVERVTSTLHGYLFYWMLFRIYAVVGVSRAVTAKFVERYPGHTGKFREILNGVDVENFYTGGKRAAVREQFGLPNDCFVVGTVANFRRIKNHPCLVRAAARLKDDYPQLRLLFVGTGAAGDPENSEPEIRSLLRELHLESRVIFAGYQDDIPAMLSAFDAFCLPSFSEGLPVSILEAMSARVAVIGSAVAGISEVVENRVTGLTFPSDDDEQLAVRLREVLEDKHLAKQLIANAYTFASQAHDKQIFHDGYLKVFQGGHV